MDQGNRSIKKGIGKGEAAVYIILVAVLGSSGLYVLQSLMMQKAPTPVEVLHNSGMATSREEFLNRNIVGELDRSTSEDRLMILWVIQQNILSIDRKMAEGIIEWMAHASIDNSMVKKKIFSICKYGELMMETTLLNTLEKFEYRHGGCKEVSHAHNIQMLRDALSNISGGYQKAFDDWQTPKSLYDQLWSVYSWRVRNKFSNAQYEEDDVCKLISWIMYLRDESPDSLGAQTIRNMLPNIAEHSEYVLVKIISEEKYWINRALCSGCSEDLLLPLAKAILSDIDSRYAKLFQETAGNSKEKISTTKNLYRLRNAEKNR